MGEPAGSILAMLHVLGLNSQPTRLLPSACWESNCTESSERMTKSFSSLATNTNTGKHPAGKLLAAASPWQKQRACSELMELKTYQFSSASVWGSNSRESRHSYLFTMQVKTASHSVTGDKANPSKYLVRHPVSKAWPQFGMNLEAEN